MAQLWKSFMEALAPPQHGEQQWGEGVTLNRTVSGCPLSCHDQPTSHAEGPGSRAPPEYWEVISSDLNVDLARETRSARVEETEQDSDVEPQDTREALPPRSLADSIAAPRFTPTTLETNTALSSTEVDSHVSLAASQITESGESLQVLNSELGTGAISMADLIEDAKFYQDATLGYQDAYETLCIQQEELQHWYAQQAQLVEEASKALWAVEAESSARHQEYVALQNQWEAEIWQAVDEAMSQYQHQLSSTQSNQQWKDKEYQHSIQKLQDQVWLLELSLAGQATLPSVVSSCSRPGLCEEVFNILPGTVNPQRGATQYESQDQAFSFHKQVWFKDNNSSPKLKPDVKSGGGRSAHSILASAPRLPNIPVQMNQSSPPKFTSTPHHVASAVPCDRTFDVSPMAPLAQIPRMQPQ